MDGTSVGVRVGRVGVDAVRLDPVHGFAHRAVEASHAWDLDQQVRAVGQVLAELVHKDAVRDVIVDAGELVEEFLRSDEAPLGRVTHLRISPTEASICTPMAAWPDAVLQRMSGGSSHIAGGTDLRGGQLVPLARERLDEVVALSEAHGADAFAIVSVGALLDEHIELAAADELAGRTGLPVTLSHQIGGLRFAEREASTILNAALLKPAGTVFDSLQRVIEKAVPSARQSFLLADGSRLGREECRSFPVRALGTHEASVAQGAAARRALDSALVLHWTPRHVELLTLESGCLRTEPLGSFPNLMAAVQLTQRRAAVLRLPPEVLTGSLAPDLVRTDLPIVLVRGLGDPIPDDSDAAGFETFAEQFSSRFTSSFVLSDPARQVAATGALAAHAQSEVLRFAVPESLGELEHLRRSIRLVAQSRVLATEPAATLRTVGDTVTPLSFLEMGPVLMRVHVAAAGRGAP